MTKLKKKKISIRYFKPLRLIKKKEPKESISGHL